VAPETGSRASLVTAADCPPPRFDETWALRRPAAFTKTTAAHKETRDLA
jgi:hypothetical protein